MELLLIQMAVTGTGFNNYFNTKNYANDGTYLGIKWQCVAYVRQGAWEHIFGLTRFQKSIHQID